MSKFNNLVTKLKEKASITQIDDKLKKLYQNKLVQAIYAIIMLIGYSAALIIQIGAITLSEIYYKTKSSFKHTLKDNDHDQ